MPRITLKYFAYIADVIKKREETMEIPDNMTVGDLLEKLCVTYGKDLQNYLFPEPNKKLNPILNFLINKININSLDGLNTRLKNNDEFVIIPPVGGG
ncbi:MAG: MoaD/ThiS family protein [Candidatus Helarchaeales archaeon]